MAVIVAIGVTSTVYSALVTLEENPMFQIVAPETTFRDMCIKGKGKGEGQFVKGNYQHL